MSRADASNLLDNRGYYGPLIRGQNPAALIEAATRDRITESLYWKEQCFGLNAATLLDRAVLLTHLGGTYGVGMRPTPFLCLAFKLLTLTPEKGIIEEYLETGGDEWKYLRALACFYVRLTSETSVECYTRLERYLGDYRKLKRRKKEGWSLVCLDEFVDELLTKERSCATALWRLESRQELEDRDLLEPRESIMQADLDAMDEEDEKDGNDGSDIEMRDENRSRSRSRGGSENGASVDGRSRSRTRTRSDSED